MVAKMMRWRPWPMMVTKKYQLNLVVQRLETLTVEGENAALQESCKFLAHIKWKGLKGKFGSRFRSMRRNCTSLQCIGDDGVVEWNESFDHVCELALQKDSAFHPWELKIQVMNDMLNESKTRASIVGAAFLNLGEFASPVENTKRTTKIPISCTLGGVTVEATLLVTLDFVDLQLTQVVFDPVQRLLVPLSCIRGSSVSEISSCTKISDKDSSEEDVSDFKRTPVSEECDCVDFFESESTDECEDDEATRVNVLGFYESFNYDTLAAANLFSAAVYMDSKKDGHGPDELKKDELNFDSLPKLTDETSSSDSDHAAPKPSKRSLLSWKNRRFSFKSSREKGEPLLNKAYREEGGDDIDFCRRQSTQYESIYEDSKHGARSSISAFGDDQFTIGSWELKELISRDGQMKLSTQVFFGSIDQRNERAAGESACTALVAVIAHWLHSNPNSMPVKSQFDTLIREGSQEWRKLCDVEDYKERFSDKHFDLDTVIQAKVRPLSVIPERSFVGFFRPECLGDSFDFLQGVMSFDDIWNEITEASKGETEDDQQHIYIVSWNDHFFVLKVERDSIYIIDTLGERLFEGCNQAYILKFDKETVIYEMPAKEQSTGENNDTVSISTAPKDSKSTTLKESKSKAVTDSKHATDDGKPSTRKDAKIPMARDSISSSKDSESTVVKDSKILVNEGKFSTETDAKNLVPKDSRSIIVKDSMSITEKDGKSPTEDLQTSIEDSNSQASESANRHQQENSTYQRTDTGTPEAASDKDDGKKLICKGKESCKAFIKGFLAALPLRELQVDLEKNLVGKNLLLHHRLQIEFHYTTE